MMGPLESGHALHQHRQRAQVERIHLVSDYDIQHQHTGLGARKRATLAETTIGVAIIGGSVGSVALFLYWLGGLTFWHGR